MAIIKTAKYLVGANVTQPSLDKKPKFQGYANKEEMLAGEGFAVTKPNSYKLVNTAYGTRRGYPSSIKHIFLHHSATHQSGGNGNMVSVFNSRGKASCHRGIDAEGNMEIILEDKYRAFCQGVKGMRPDPNGSGMSVELISMGYLIDTPIIESDGTYYKQKPKHGKQYWVKKENTTLSVDFNGNEKAYRGWARWNAYTQPQVDATVALIKEWCKAYTIPFVFNQSAFDLMFPPKNKVNSAWRKKIGQTPGVYSHNTLKQGKSDIYPDPLLIKAFKKEFPPGNPFDSAGGGVLARPQTAVKPPPIPSPPNFIPQLNT